MWHLCVKVPMPAPVYANAASQLYRMQFKRRFGDEPKGVKWIVSPIDSTMQIDMYSENKAELEVSSSIKDEIANTLKRQSFWIKLAGRKAVNVEPEVVLEEL